MINKKWVEHNKKEYGVQIIELKKIIWLRARRFPWTRIAKTFGMSRHKAKKAWEEELIYVRLWLQLHSQQKKINDIIDKIVIRTRYTN